MWWRVNIEQITEGRTETSGSVPGGGPKGRMRGIAHDIAKFFTNLPWQASAPATPVAAATGAREDQTTGVGCHA